MQVKPKNGKLLDTAILLPKKLLTESPLKLSPAVRSPDNASPIFHPNQKLETYKPHWDADIFE